MKDYYEVLGVKRDATQDEIRSAYRTLAKKFHPDVNPNKKEAEARFKDIGEAYGVLGDPEKRRRHDAGDQGFMGFRFDPFEWMGARQAQRQERSGENIVGRIEISLEEVATGASRTVSVDRLCHCDACGRTGSSTSKRKKCNACGGSGRVMFQSQNGFMTFRQVVACEACDGKGSVPEASCPACGGAGCLRKSQAVEIRVPIGASSRDVLKVEGMGHLDGDLLIYVQVKPHPVFERDGNDLRCRIEVPFSIALGGGEVEIEGLLKEKVKVQVPRTCVHGREAAVNGKGIAGGDLKVTLLYSLPKLDDPALSVILGILKSAPCIIKKPMIGQADE